MRTGDSTFLRVLRGALGLALVIGIGGGVVWGGRTYVRTSPRFGVTEIVTSGGKRRSPDDLAATAGIAKGQNVFTLDLAAARTKLIQDPWIAEASLTRQLPGTISIRVTERDAAGLVSMAEGTYLVTREGVVIKRLELGDPTDLHIVTGVSIQQIVDDREAATRSIRRALDLAGDYDHTPLAQRSALQEVHVEQNGDLSLVIGKSAVVLKLGSAPYRRKLEQAVRVTFEIDRRGGKADAIMLDNETRPDRVVVRMR